MIGASKRNVLLAGLPRSGTTLTCHLLNKVDNCVAMHEPLAPHSLAGLEQSDIVVRIKSFFEAQRLQILESGTATSKAFNKQIPPNHLLGRFDGRGRKRLLNGRIIRVTNVKCEDFSLFVKHPNMFTACLPFLRHQVECFAIMRNPLAVLLSWRNAEMNVTRGRIPAGELFDKDLAARLDGLPDVLDRQFYLLNYFFDRFERFLSGRTVRYEDIIASGGRVLSLLHPSASNLNERLKSRNRLGVQADPDASTIAKRLLRSDGPYWSFYAKEDVKRLLL